MHCHISGTLRREDGLDGRSTATPKGPQGRNPALGALATPTSNHRGTIEASTSSTVSKPASHLRVSERNTLPHLNTLYYSTQQLAGSSLPHTELERSPDAAVANINPPSVRNSDDAPTRRRRSLRQVQQRIIDPSHRRVFTL